MADVRVQLLLSRSQAIVLFEWLSRLSSPDSVADATEQRVLWILEGQLERLLVEPLKPEYPELVEAARRAVDEGE